ncbi:hypothetical protein [Sphaerochaeta sp. PS]|uniref:hypothetical protein n=1 Tax=Sphaerochaeta sp. PS TaxID=3076336 RepID=UPI0028A5068B|nr:hypothetical protein [Sphaerochaeta sp. PS]MDT4761960.1 hypothetical protein [Sphaerochaeta sp. PS]
MKRKEFVSLALTMLVLLLSMLTGYVLLSFVYVGSPFLVGLVGLGVLVVSVFLVVYLVKLRKLIDEVDEDENKTQG